MRITSENERALTQGERNALERLRRAAREYSKALDAMESAAVAFVREGTAATSRRFPSRAVTYANAMGQRSISIEKRAAGCYLFGIGGREPVSIPFLAVLEELESTLDLPTPYDGLLGCEIFDARKGKVRRRGI